MKIQFILIGIGIFFLVIGPSLSNFYTNSILEKYPSLSILISSVMLEPAENIRGSIALEKGEKIFVTIVAEPALNSVYLVINSTKNSFSNEFRFSESTTFPLYANSTDDFILSIGNLGPDTANVKAFSSINQILDEDEVIFKTDTGIVISFSLMIIGIILLIIGFLIFAIYRKRNKTLTNENQGN
jgi:hypothetical protein